MTRAAPLERSRVNLEAALKAGNIPIADESLEVLDVGLAVIAHGYSIERLRRVIKSPVSLTKDLTRLCDALHIAVAILDADFAGARQFEALWFVNRLPGGLLPDGFLEEMRFVLGRANEMRLMCEQAALGRASEAHLNKRWDTRDGTYRLVVIRDDNTRAKAARHQQHLETWFMLSAHELFAQITGTPKPGIAAPLHRFTHHCAALVDPDLIIPKNADGFRKRLSAALRGRDAGKVTVSPIQVSPRKN